MCQVETRIRHYHPYDAWNQMIPMDSIFSYKIISLVHSIVPSFFSNPIYISQHYNLKCVIWSFSCNISFKMTCTHFLFKCQSSTRSSQISNFNILGYNFINMFCNIKISLKTNIASSPNGFS